MKLTIEVEDGITRVLVDGEPLGAINQLSFHVSTDAVRNWPMLHVAFMQAYIDSGLAARSVELLRNLPFCTMEGVTPIKVGD